MLMLKWFQYSVQFNARRRVKRGNYEREPPVPVETRLLTIGSGDISLMRSLSQD